jgi:hypothetical protein
MLYGAADAQNEQLGLPWEVGISEERDEGQALLKASMKEAFDISYGQGRVLTLDAAVRLALRDGL